MAVKATQQTDTDIATPENAEAASGADAAQQAIKTLMRLGKERGYVTHDELNAALPEGDYTSEQIDDYMSKLSEMGQLLLLLSAFLVVAGLQLQLHLQLPLQLQLQP